MAEEKKAEKKVFGIWPNPKNPLVRARYSSLALVSVNFTGSIVRLRRDYRAVVKILFFSRKITSFTRN
jgi:hypothetical protein